MELVKIKRQKRLKKALARVAERALKREGTWNGVKAKVRWARIIRRLKEVGEGSV